jgi:hypothetical protein
MSQKHSLTQLPQSVPWALTADSWGDQMRKAPFFMVLVCCLLVIGSSGVATSSEFFGAYVRDDGGAQLLLKSDQTYQFRFSSGGKIFSGLYEPNSCTPVDGGNPGNHIFYTADGKSCCVQIKKIGSRLLIVLVAGPRLQVCYGGVFSRQN